MTNRKSGKHPKQPWTEKAGDKEKKHLSTVPDGRQVQELTNELKRVSQNNEASSTSPKRLTTISQRRQFDEYLHLLLKPNGVQLLLNLLALETNLATFLFVLSEQDHLDRFLTQLEDFPTGYREWVSFLEKCASWVYFKNLLTKQKFMASTTNNPIKYKTRTNLDFKPEPRITLTDGNGKERLKKEETATQKAVAGYDNASRTLDGCLTPEYHAAEDNADTYGWLSTNVGSSRCGSENAICGSRPASCALTPRSEAFMPMGESVDGWMINVSEGINAPGELSNAAMGASRAASGTATPEIIHFSQPPTALDDLLSPTFASTSGKSVNANSGSNPASGTATPADFEGSGFYEAPTSPTKHVASSPAMGIQNPSTQIGAENPGKRNRRSRRSRKSRKSRNDEADGGGGGGGVWQAIKKAVGGDTKTDAGPGGSDFNKAEMSNRGLRREVEKKRALTAGAI